MNTPMPDTNPGNTLALHAVIEIQDDLITACNDLDRLQGLLRDACAALGEGFHGAVDLLAQPRSSAADAALVLLRLDEHLSRTVTALQFDDMSSQLITHTRGRLRHSADRLATTLLGEDEDGAGFVEQAPRRPNPVTQDEMDAGSVELF